MDDGFLCNSFIPAEQISVQQGDIIGICLPRTNSLDIVSDTSGGSVNGNKLLYSEDDCSTIPGFVINLTPLGVLVFQENRIAHVYAQITSKIFTLMSSLILLHVIICLTANTGDRIPVTSSESEPSTPPPVSDQPPMYRFTTMLTSSRQLSITPTVTVVASERRLSILPTSMELPLISITTETG